jgi:hypothetical protein
MNWSVFDRPTPALSKENDFSADYKRIRDGRIPIVECPCEVLKEEQR